MDSLRSFKPIRILITSVINAGTTYDITSISSSFRYFEDIDKPFVMAELSLIDSGINLIKTLPIQGGEQVTITLECASSKNGSPTVDETTYDFHVWKVRDRNFSTKIQTYTLVLLPIEAFANEYSRVVRKLTGHPSEIVQQLLKEELATEKNISVEKTKNKVSFFPARKSVASLIQSLQIRSISEKASQRKIDNKQSTSTTNKKKSENSENDVKISGTAGYFFFQNKNGFVFKSIDLICSVGNQGSFSGTDVLGTYYAKPGMDSSDPQNYFVISNYKFTDEIDILDKLRRGSYSTKLVFYNVSTGDYEEFVYSLNDTFKDMVKLGKQDKLPDFQVKQSEIPTRVMSMVIDHETWHYDETIANPEDEKVKGNAEYVDESKYLIAQGIARRSSLELQKLEIVIPGNSSIVVGEKLKIYLPNMASEGSRSTTPWDTESSGNYLISKLSHNYEMAVETGPKFTTVIELIRDTYGMEEDASGVK
jgi:hypothetical protein